MTIDLTLGSYGGTVAAHKPRAARPSPEYLSPYGLPMLRKQIADLNGVLVDNVAISSGASLGLVVSLLMFAPNRVLIPDVYYPAYRSITELLGQAVDTYPVHGGVPSVPGSAALIWNSPHNPTGRTDTLADRSALAALSVGGTQVIEDRVYDDLAFAPEVVDSAVSCESHVLLGSLSKSLALAGERVGFAIANAATITRFATAHWAVAMSTSSSSQWIASMALSDLEQPVEVDARRILRLRAAEMCNRALGNLVSSSDLAAPFFAWIRLPPGSMGSDVAQRCAQAGVLVSDGADFGSPTSIRISLISTPLPTLARALETILRVVRETSPSSEPKETK